MRAILTLLMLMIASEAWANLLSVASDAVAQRRAKKYGDKIAAPD